MSKMSKSKGARGERELANILAEHLGIDVARNLSQSRDGGHDLDGLPLAVEVKRRETLRLGEWWQQAVEQAYVCGKVPALAFRQNRQPWQFLVPPYVIARAVTGKNPKCFRPEPWSHDFEYACQVSLAGFVFIVRELLAG